MRKYRLLSSDLITGLMQPEAGATTGEGLRRRLTKLWHNGFLDRPRNQALPVYQVAGGARHFIYALGHKGAQHLADQSEECASLLTDWSKKNRELKPTTIVHELQIARFRATLTLAIEQQDNLKLLNWKQGPEIARRFRVKDTNKQTGEVRYFAQSLSPDAQFCLEVPPTTAGRFLYFYLECDRSTERAAGRGRHPYLDKLVRYWRYWRGLNALKFHLPGQGPRDPKVFRVLTLTLSEKRRDNLAELARQADDRQTGSALFWFASETDLDFNRPNSILAPIWVTPADNDWHSLLE